MSCLSTPLRFLPVVPQELRLASSLLSGQSFRWHRSSPVHATRPETGTAPSDVDGEEWSFAWGDRTVVLRQDDHGVHYRSLYPFAPPHAAYLQDVANDTTRPLLVDYFQLATPLAPLYSQWRSADDKFAKKLDADERRDSRLRGIRVLKQDEWETLVSFICSANNNIARITLMVNRVCAQLGNRLPHPSHFDPDHVYERECDFVSAKLPPPTPPPNDLALYSFPTPESLADIAPTEALLRRLGFGYRANYIPTSARHLVETCRDQKTTPIEYLKSLRRDAPRAKGGTEQTDDERLKLVREKLLEFKGVGRKVADCVMLFGLGWSQVVPVDTHVFQIAVRDYGFPGSKTASLTPALHDKVSEHLAKKWQPHAGWCQQVLFFADLKSNSSTTLATPTKTEVTFTKIEFDADLDDDEVDAEIATARQKKKTFEDDVREIMENPGRKRRRTTVVKSEKVECKREFGDAKVVVKGEGAV